MAGLIFTDKLGASLGAGKSVRAYGVPSLAGLDSPTPPSRHFRAGLLHTAATRLEMHHPGASCSGRPGTRRHLQSCQEGRNYKVRVSRYKYGENNFGKVGGVTWLDLIF